jgi:hypothetical protein
MSIIMKHFTAGQSGDVTDFLAQYETVFVAE